MHGRGLAGTLKRTVGKGMSRMNATSAPPEREQSSRRVAELVARVAIVLAIASAVTLAAMVLIGFDSGWALVAGGEAAMALALLSQT